jgi:hypothetical protein
MKLVFEMQLTPLVKSGESVVLITKQNKQTTLDIILNLFHLILIPATWFHLGFILLLSDVGTSHKAVLP